MFYACCYWLYPLSLFSLHSLKLSYHQPVQLDAVYDNYPWICWNTLPIHLNPRVTFCLVRESQRGPWYVVAKTALRGMCRCDGAVARLCGVCRLTDRLQQGRRGHTMKCLADSFSWNNGSTKGEAGYCLARSCRVDALIGQPCLPSHRLCILSDFTMPTSQSTAISALFEELEQLFRQRYSDNYKLLVFGLEMRKIHTQMFDANNAQYLYDIQIWAKDKIQTSSCQ